MVLIVVKNVSRAVARLPINGLLFACMQSRDHVTHRTDLNVKAHQRMTIQVQPSTTTPDVKLDFHSNEPRDALDIIRDSIQH